MAFSIVSFYCCWNQLYNWTYKTLKSITFSINLVFCIDYLIFHGTIKTIPAQHCYSSSINNIYVQNGYPEAHDKFKSIIWCEFIIWLFRYLWYAKQYILTMMYLLFFTCGSCYSSFWFYVLCFLLCLSSFCILYTQITCVSLLSIRDSFAFL